MTIQKRFLKRSPERAKTVTQVTVSHKNRGEEKMKKIGSYIRNCTVLLIGARLCFICYALIIKGSCEEKKCVNVKQVLNSIIIYQLAPLCAIFLQIRKILSCHAIKIYRKRTNKGLHSQRGVLICNRWRSGNNKAPPRFLQIAEKPLTD